MKDLYYSRIQAVRNEMDRINLDAFLVPHEDEYLLEEVSDFNNRLKWVSGFSGTAGVAVVLKNDVFFFVDGRYKVQVTEQVNEHLFSIQELSSFEDNSWVNQLLPSFAKIGVDLTLHSYSWFQSFMKTVTEEGKECIRVENNFIDLCWKNRPKNNLNLISIFDEKYHGKPSNKKIKEVTDILRARKIESKIITSLDSICWLLNLRGHNIASLPVFYATAIVHQSGEVLCFLDLQQISERVINHFDAEVSFRCKSELGTYLSSTFSESVQVDPMTINASLASLISAKGIKMVQDLDLISLLKSPKNAVEMAGMKACHIRDGGAVVNFLSWLDEKVRAKSFYDEAVLADKLERFRVTDELYQEPSFDTVSAVGSNGAMCHYNHKDTIPKRMVNNSIYLVDSGAHYLDGSTDVTRTVAIGKANNEQIKMATLVLKGHISLATMKFPQGTTGQQLDAFARQHLWQHGYDYEHGTGHGVGHYLYVHEGPQRISKHNSDVPLLPGMVVSIEPGYYRKGEFGIRHENLYFIRECEMPDGAEIKMLQFEVLTFVPFDRKLIDKTALTTHEIQWLNKYHQMVYQKISPLLNKDRSKWLEIETKIF